MQEIKEALDLIIKSQAAMQTEVTKLNSKIDDTNERIYALDERFEQKLDETNQRISTLDQKFEKRIDAVESRLDQKISLCYNKLDQKLNENLEDIAEMFNSLFSNVLA